MINVVIDSSSRLDNIKRNLTPYQKVPDYKEHETELGYKPIKKLFPMLILTEYPLENIHQR